MSAQPTSTTPTASPETSSTGSTGWAELPLNPGNALRDTWVITKRNLIRNTRLPQLMVFATIQPIMFLVLFNVVFGGTVGDQLPEVAGGKYLNFLLPGLLVQISAFGAGQTALGLSEDLSKGVVSRFRSLPMSRAAVLAGRTLADILRNAFVMTLMLGVGFLMGFRYQTSFPRFVAGVLVVLAFAYALSWVMAFMGLKVKSPEAVQSAVFVPVFPFVFASAVFVPTATLPSWLRGFAENQPVTVVAEAARGLILGPGALAPGQTVGGQAFLALLWCAAITAVAAPLAVRVYRRSAS